MSTSPEDTAVRPVRSELEGAVRLIADAAARAQPGAEAAIAAALAAVAEAADTVAAQDGDPAASSAADLLAALARQLQERGAADAAEPVIVDRGMFGARSRGGFYNGFCGWTDGADGDVVGGGKRMRPLLAEGIGAGVVAADCAESYYPAASQRHYDVWGDGAHVDVKLAWHHDGDRLGVPPAPARGYDPARVQEICPVQLEYVRGRHGYLPDGTMWVLTWARPSAVFRVPVKKYARMIRPDGRSRGRSLVERGALERFRVRSIES